MLWETQLKKNKKKAHILMITSFLLRIELFILPKFLLNVYLPENGTEYTSKKKNIEGARVLIFRVPLANLCAAGVDLDQGQQNASQHLCRSSLYKDRNTLLLRVVKK